MPKTVLMKKGGSTINVDANRQKYYEGKGYAVVKPGEPEKKDKKPSEGKPGGMS